MAEPIRVLHFADAHIGMENYGRTDPATGLSTRLGDFVHRLDEMIAYARENDVDLTIFAGDAFKSRTPSPTHQRELAHRIRDLAELAPVVLLEGNHDLPQMDKKASAVEIYNTLAVPNVIVANTFTTTIVETKRGPVFLGFAPYPVRQQLMRDQDTAGKTIAELDRLMAHVLGSALEGFAEQADEYDMPRLLTGHFTVTGAIWGSERQIMLGRDVEAPLSVIADPRWDYVAMGHIHKHQNLTDGQKGAPPVVYSGSIERIDFGEEHDHKGFCWVELERGKSSYQFIELNARPFVTISADLREDENPTHTLIELIEKRALTGAVVRVRVEMKPETEARLDEGMIRDALKRGGAHVIAGIEKRVQQAARARLGGNPEELSDEDLLERYLLSKEVPPVRRESLHQLADPIFAGHLEDGAPDD
ncbi:MAG: exonuclease SbcCD subunit D [Anaerolineae bacterium]|nr:exonuclease SbcCD subunit D [Anaerolineae bacterium]